MGCGVGDPPNAKTIKKKKKKKTIVTPGEDSVSGVCVSAAESAGAEEHCSRAERYLVCC